MKTAKTIGILGGMGPQASCELYRLVNRKCTSGGLSVRNADFPHLIINNLPVPDLINSEDEKEKTISMAHEGALALERAGATDILMSCNTMHAYQDRIVKNLHANFHSLIDIVADASKGSKKVLLLSTRTTIATGLYQKAFTQRGIAFNLPDDSLISASVDIILSIIAEKATERQIRQYVDLVVQTAKSDPAVDTIVLGCTELPLFFPMKIEGYRVISSLHEAADRILSLHFGIRCGDGERGLDLAS